VSSTKKIKKELKTMDFQLEYSCNKTKGESMDSFMLLKIFVKVDDFFKKVKKCEMNYYLGERKVPKSRLNASEIVTILIGFHYSNRRTFKSYYQEEIETYHKKDFPDLVSYNRFVELQQYYMWELYLFSKTFALGENTGISFVDSTILRTGHIKREKSLKVFENVAEKSKSTLGWYVGFKLHVISNHLGEIVDYQITSSRKDERKTLEGMVGKIKGKLFGDRGYISSELTEKLKNRGITLITKLRENMKKIKLSDFDSIMLRKRAIIESLFDKLKNQHYLEHTRHRSKTNFLINIFAAISAYHFNYRKPSFNLQFQQAVSTFQSNNFYPEVL